MKIAKAEREKTTKYFKDLYLKDKKQIKLLKKQLANCTEQNLRLIKIYKKLKKENEILKRYFEKNTDIDINQKLKEMK